MNSSKYNFKLILTSITLSVFLSVFSFASESEVTDKKEVKPVAETTKNEVEKSPALEEQPKVNLSVPVQNSTPAPKKKIAKPVEQISFSPQKAMPESVTRVDLSGTQINRIIAPPGHTIKDVIIQKGTLQAKIEGKNAFLSFPKTFDPMTQGIKTSDEATEVYVVVAPDTVYTLIGNPKQINAQTIQLGGDDSKIKQNLELFDGMPLEKKAVLLTKTALSNDLPESFAQKKIGQKINIFSSLDLFLNRIVMVDGENLILKEYFVTLKGEERTMQLQEKNFLKPELSKKPIGITLENNTLLKGQVTRLFIVERKG